MKKAPAASKSAPKPAAKMPPPAKRGGRGGKSTMRAKVC